MFTSPSETRSKRMPSSSPSDDLPSTLNAPKNAHEAARSGPIVAAWTVGIFAGVHVIGALLAGFPGAALVAQALLVGWGAGRLGLRWTARGAPESTNAEMRRAALGGGVGLVLGGIVVLFLSLTKAIVLTPSAPTFTPILIAFMNSVLFAVRDELCFRGLVLHAIGDAPKAIPKMVACAVVAAAAAGGVVGASAALIVTQACLGLIFSALWLRDEGAWAPCAAHAAWLFTTTILMQGVLFEATVMPSAWGGGSAGALGGFGAAIALLLLAAGAIAGMFGTRRTDERR